MLKLNEIYFGDCLDIMPTLPDHSIDMVLCDLPYEITQNHPSSWQKFNTETGLHSTQKPVLLFECLIKTYTNEGELVLDNACGSGTTGIACLKTNRNYILIDDDLKSYNTSKKRINDYK